jgi:DNA polymerase-3 subunit delta'
MADRRETPGAIPKLTAIERKGRAFMSWSEIIGHDRPKKILRESLSRSALAHAYLFFGEESVGKRTTARVFAQAVQCEKPERGEPCGACRSCRLFRAESHPDVSFIGPEDDQIKIDQVRAIQDALIFKPLAGSRKVLIMDDADAMNLAAANCFLKTVEEPPDHSLLILVSSRPHRLPATILSRCQQVRFDPPNQGEVARFLSERRGMPQGDAELTASLCMGRIGRALGVDPADLRGRRDRAVSLVRGKSLQEIGNILEQAAAAASDEDFWSEALDWIRIWLRDLLIRQISSDTALLINTDRAAELAESGRAYSTASLLEALTLLEAFRRSLNRNLNRTMVMETLLLELRRRMRVEAA